jgi:hypothetical protein
MVANHCKQGQLGRPLGNGQLGRGTLFTLTGAALHGCVHAWLVRGRSAVVQRLHVSEATVAFTLIYVTVIGTGHGATRARWRGH